MSTMNDFKTVRFIRRDSPFEIGDHRELPAAEAAKFVRQGAAEYVGDWDPGSESEEFE